MGRFAAVLVLVFLGIVFVSGCTEPRDEEAGVVMESTNRWLGTGQGRAKFPEGAAGEPIRVWREGETLYWIIPIERDGMYIGNLIVTQEDFTSPQQIVEYKEPRERILKYTQSEAYQQIILENPGYPAWQIEEPILLSVEGEGLYWYSRVKSGGQALDELYLETFTMF